MAEWLILQLPRGSEGSCSWMLADAGGRPISAPQSGAIAQANLSRHLQQLLALGFVTRRKRGLFAYYRLADREVLRLCELMCGRLEKETTARRAALKSA